MEQASLFSSRSRRLTLAAVNPGTIPNTAPSGRKYRPFTADDARKGRERRAELREARKAGKASGKSLAQYHPQLAVVTDEAARALLPRILSDEIAWRSELLATVRMAELALIDCVRKEIYDASKQTLPQIVNSLVKVVELSERLVEKTKKLDLTGASADQVTGLFAKSVLLRGELVRRGIMDQQGNFIVRAALAETEPEAPGDTIDGLPIPEHGPDGDRVPDASGGSQTADAAGAAAVADAPPPDEEGV